MSEIAGLQAIINKRADRKLEACLKTLFDPIGSLKLDDGETECRRRNSPNFATFGNVMFDMEKHAFGRLQESWREKEAADFLSRVETLGTQIDELREEIAQE